MTTRVLIAEDNANLADALKVLLQIDGYEVRTARNGREALEIAASFSPDVALIDLNMPGLDGFELAQALRNLDVTSKAILVAVTGLSGHDAVERSRLAGFDHHFAKAADIEPLLNLVHSAATH